MVMTFTGKGLVRRENQLVFLTTFQSFNIDNACVCVIFLLFYVFHIFRNSCTTMYTRLLNISRMELYLRMLPIT